MARWFAQFEARLPDDPDSKFWEVGVHEHHFRDLQKYGHEKELARLRLVKAVLDDTLTH